MGESCAKRVKLHGWPRMINGVRSPPLQGGEPPRRVSPVSIDFARHTLVTISMKRPRPICPPRSLGFEHLEPRNLLSGLPGWSEFADAEGEGNPPHELSVYYGLAYPPTMRDNTQLATVDSETGQVTWIGQPMTNPNRLHGLVMTNTGELFGINSDPDKNTFYSVDRTAGQATLVGATGYYVAAGLAYDPAGDTIYALGRTSSSSLLQYLLTIDRHTGQATAIGPGTTNLPSVSGLTWDTARNRVLAYSTTYQRFAAFDVEGRVSSLGSSRAMPLTTWGLAYHEGAVVVPMRDADPDTRFLRLDADTGQSTGVPLTLSEPLVIGALDYGEIPPLWPNIGGFTGFVGIGYSMLPSRPPGYHLFIVNPADGVVTWLGDPLPADAPRSGIVVTKDFRLYGISADTDSFYQFGWNPSNPVLIGSSGFELAAGLGYDAATDTIYGVGKSAATGGLNRLLHFNRWSGTATSRGTGSDGINGVSGLDWDATNNRLVVFDTVDDQFWGFDAQGNATLLSTTAEPLETWGVAHDGESLIVPLRWNYDRLLCSYIPETMARTGNTLRFSELMAFESLEYLANVVPQTTVSASVDAHLTQVQIALEAYDSDSDAVISLFYDRDNQGFDGTPITQGLPETDGNSTYSWDFRGVQDGDYYIYAEINDGLNFPQYAYTIAPVSLMSPSIRGHAYLDQNLSGKWEEGEERALPAISVYLDRNRNGQHDDGEPISVTQVEDPTTSALELGLYVFRELDFGEYMVRALPVSPYSQASPTGHLVNITGTPPVAGVDFGLHSELRNPVNIHDVNNDLRVSPLDALLIINWLNLAPVDRWPDAAPPYLDVSGDLYISPLDALLVINRLIQTQGAGEGETAQPVGSPSNAQSVQGRSDESCMQSLHSPRSALAGTDDESDARPETHEVGLPWSHGPIVSDPSSPFMRTKRWKHRA